MITILIIVTEMMVGAEYGLGEMIVTSQYQFETAKMLSVIFILGLIGSGINSLFLHIEKSVFHWR